MAEVLSYFELVQIPNYHHYYNNLDNCSLHIQFLYHHQYMDYFFKLAS